MAPRTPNVPSDDDDQDDIQKAPETTEQLLARIRALESELELAGAAKLIAEDESARLSAQAQSTMFTTNVIERFAGKDEDQQDMWWYKIDLAPCGGIEIKINGVPYYHGQTYKLDTSLLRSIKEIVARTWDHENNIMGANENVYKVAQDRMLRGGDRRR